MAPKHEVKPDSEDEGPETLEVQIEAAEKRSRQKGVPAHKEQGRSIQAKGTQSRKDAGAASKRELAVKRQAKKNDHLQRLADIAAAEKAEKERSARLETAVKDDDKEPRVDHVGDIDARFERLEKLLMARNAESEREKPSKKPRAKKVRAPTPDSSDSDEEVPRQKAVRRSAKTELKRQAGATEEAMLKHSKLVGNRHKASALQMDAEREFRMLGSQLMPGREWG